MIKTIRRDLQSFYSYPNIDCIDRKIKLRHFLKAYLDIDFRAVFIYRIACFFIGKGMKKIGILLYYRLKSAHAIDISPYAIIGPGLKLVHAFNIVIGPDVSLGNNCVCFNSVTLGNAHPGWKREGNYKKGMPSVGDRVILCPGVRIVGNIILGNDVFIGANSVVLRSIPSCETWAGIPAKKISYNNFCDK
jgi:serine O-acetyltransferase